MPYTLDNRDKLRRAFWRLCDTSSSDDALIEQDSETNESVHYFLMQGLWLAQDYVIRYLEASRWVKTSSAIVWVAETDGSYSVALPTDVLRLSAKEDDPTFSALHEANGKPWGRLCRWEDRYLQSNLDRYFLANTSLYRVSGSNPPATLYFDYHFRHPTLSSDDGTVATGAIDFPLEWRPLIVAYAGIVASTEGWLPDGSNTKTKLEANLAFWQTRCGGGFRRSRGGQHLRAARVLNGNRWL